jgi:hypothetical protein
MPACPLLGHQTAAAALHTQTAAVTQKAFLPVTEDWVVSRSQATPASPPAVTAGTRCHAARRRLFHSASLPLNGDLRPRSAGLISCDLQVGLSFPASPMTYEYSRSRRCSSHRALVYLHLTASARPIAALPASGKRPVFSTVSYHLSVHCASVKSQISPQTKGLFIDESVPRQTADSDATVIDPLVSGSVEGVIRNVRRRRGSIQVRIRAQDGRARR